MAKPSPPRTSGSHSIRRPARRSAFWRRSIGARGSFCGDHGLGQEVDLLAVQFGPVAGHDESGQLDLGIVVAGDVLHDGPEVFPAEAFAADLAEQHGHRGRRLGLRDRGRVPVLHAQLLERVFRQAQLVAADDGRVVDHVHRGQDVAPVGAHLDLRQGLEALGPVHGAVAVQVGDVLVPGVDGDPAQGQGGRCGRIMACGGDRGGGAGVFGVHPTSLPGMRGAGQCRQPRPRPA
jgi:hypothetical protein